MTTYRQKWVPHETHLMETYPDGRYQFCRYYGCGYREKREQGAWVAYPGGAGRRKPKNSMVYAEQLQLFPMTNEEAARLFVQRPRRGRAKQLGRAGYIDGNGVWHV